MSDTVDTQITNPYYTYGVLYESEEFSNWEIAQGKAYASYREEWFTRPRDTEPGDFPLNLNVEITTRCNLACTFCTHSSLVTSQIGDVSFPLFEDLLSEGQEYGLATVNLNGLGEPLLNKDCTRFVRRAKESGVLDVMFHTNATIMTEKLADSLIQSGLDRIVFSVDSPDQHTYESMRLLRSSYLKSKQSDLDHPIRGFSWTKILQNVNMFVDYRDRIGSKTPMVRTTMVVTDKTVDQVSMFVNLWKEIADQITVQDLTWRTKLLDNDDWTNQEKSALPVRFDAIRERAIEEKIAFVCPVLYQSSYLFFDGTIIPCSNPNARTHMIMGQLGDDNLHDIWTGETYSSLRELHESGRWFEHPICRNCEVALVELYKVVSPNEENTIGSTPAHRTGEDMSLAEVQVAISDSRQVYECAKE